MHSSNRFFIAAAATTVLFIATAAEGAHLDMSDPRRALGRQDDIRVDAQLLQDTISSSSAIGVTYQIQNLTSAPIAVADKMIELDFDSESRVVTLSIGAEVPTGTTVPHLVVIPAGEKRTLTVGGMLHAAIPNVQSRFAVVPRSVQVKVSVLRDLEPFAAVLEAQKKANAPLPLPNDLFDRWVESADSVYLNPIPVRWKVEPSRGADASVSRIDPQPNF